MKAKICDRCGTAFKDHGVKLSGEKDYQVMEIRFSHEWGRITRYQIDLCPTCRKQIKQWLAVEA